MSRVRNLVDFTTLTHDFDGDGTLDFSVTGTVTSTALDSPDVPKVDLTIAPEVLEIQVAAPAAGQATTWLWTWLQSTLPYARREITNSPESQVPLYLQGTYTVNNYAAYDIFDDMTQTHSLYLKWIDGAGTDNLVSWATITGPVSDTHPDINGGNATDVQRINISVPSSITLPTLTAPSVSYTVTNNGSGAYTFSGSAKGDNPQIGPFYRGGTYTFNVSATGHPFYLTTDNGTNFAAGTYFGEYTDGVTGSRSDSGTLTIVVPNDAPDTLYYQCGNHGAMRGAITVKDLEVETNNNGNYIVYFQHTQEGHKTPVELRPIPSLVNQMCIVYDANSGKFVPQDLATYVENTPSFENKIREVAGTAELVVEDGSAVVAKVNVYYDSTYLPLVGNNAGDQAFATDNNTLYVWDGSAWQPTKGGTLTTINATGDVTIGGNLTVNGTTTTINSTTVEVDDLNLTLASGAINATAANGAGITIDGASANITYNSVDDNWNINKSLVVTDNNVGNPGGITIKNTNTDAYSHGEVRIESENGAAYSTIFTDAQNSALRLGYNTSGSTLNINSSGNVGIGTTSPGSPLHVAGSAGTGYALAAFGSGSDSALVAIGTGNSNGVPGSQTWSHGDTYAAAITFGNVGSGGRTQSRTHAAIYSTNVQTYGKGDLAFATKGSSDNADPIERMRIKRNGNIGIGETNPENLLHIKDLGGPIQTKDDAILQLEATTAGNVAEIFFSAVDTNSVGRGASIGFDAMSGSDNQLYLANGGVKVLTVPSDGRVGIGTDAPATKLHVKEPAATLTVESSNTSYAGLQLKATTQSDGGTAGYLYGYSGTQFLGGIKFNRKDSNSGDILFRQQINASNTDVGAWSDGYFGIGTTSPEVKLEVNGGADGSVVFAGRSDGGNGNNRRFNLIAYADGGGANYGGGLKIQTRDSVNVFHDRITVQSNGNVGIGTLNADYKLTVAGDPGDDAITLLSLVHTDTNFGNGTGFNHAVNIEFNLPANRGGDTDPRTAALIRGRKGASDWFTGSADSTNFQGQLAFYTRQDNVLTQQMMIDEDGNVGIGGDATAGKLHVICDSTQNTPLYVSSTADHTKILVDNGNTNAYYSYLQLVAQNSGSGYLIKNNNTGGNGLPNGNLHLWNDANQNGISVVPNGDIASRWNFNTDGSLYGYNGFHLQLKAQGSVPSLTAGSNHQLFSVSALADSGLYIIRIGAFQQGDTGGTLWGHTFVSEPYFFYGGTSNDGRVDTIDIMGHGHASNGKNLSMQLDYSNGSHSWGRILINPTFNYTPGGTQWYAYKLIDM